MRTFRHHFQKCLIRVACKSRFSIVVEYWLRELMQIYTCCSSSGATSFKFWQGDFLTSSKRTGLSNFRKRACLVWEWILPLLALCCELLAIHHKVQNKHRVADFNSFNWISFTYGPQISLNVKGSGEVPWTCILIQSDMLGNMSKLRQCVVYMLDFRSVISEFVCFTYVLLRGVTLSCVFDKLNFRGVIAWCVCCILDFRCVILRHVRYILDFISVTPRLFCAC
jgi:hypothetical protein